MRKALIAVALAALAVAGAASAFAITRHVTLKPGQCMTIKGMRVCAAKAKTRTVVHMYTVTSPGRTVTSPAQTVTTPGRTVTMTVTVPAATPPPPTTTTINPSPVTESYSGDGDLTEAPFTTPVGETLSWTWVNGNGDFPTGMFINDDSAGQVLVDSMGTSGSTYLAPGTHTLSIITIGTWTIHVGP
jgi:hypothetical protein